MENLLGRLLLGALLVVRASALAQPSRAATDDPLVALMAEELKHSMTHLVTEDGTRPYFLAYTVTHSDSITVVGTLGAMEQNDQHRVRVLDVDVRVGDYALDNTHQIRGGADGRFGRLGGSALVPLENTPLAVKHVLWQTTDGAFKSAVERFQRVKTDLKTKVEEEHKAEDFSREKPSVHFEPDAELTLNREQWAQRIRNVSRLALKYPLVHESSVAVVGSANNRAVVTSEGTRLKTGQKHLRVLVSASTKAEDGMALNQSFLFNSSSESGLPNEEQMREAFQKVLDVVMALRAAPLVEPYTGPAILLNRASGVFFHEIFGHRIEGHRQKNVEEGQTFTKMVGKPILPEFLSVIDDPTHARFGDEDLALEAFSGSPPQPERTSR